MLWTLCSAGYLALFRARGMPNETATLHRTSGVVFGVIMGAVLAGAIVLGYNRFRLGPPMLRHPGHWLLVVTAILWWTGGAISFLFIMLGSNGWFNWPIVVFAVVYSFSAVAYLFAARCLVVPRWKLLFFAMAGVTQSTAFSISALVLVSNGYGCYPRSPPGVACSLGGGSC